MIEKTIGWCFRKTFLVFLFVAVLLAGGIWSLYRIPLDAIPDLSDVQVIVYSEWTGRSPDLVEDQITYPIVSSLIAAPKVKYVRGASFLGLSFVTIIFQDGTDMYWARSRVLEYLNKMAGRLPEDVRTALGPDATGVGWVYEYALVDESGNHDLADLRTLQDWYLKYWLESVPGVAEVASVGGFVKQYQILLNPNTLNAYRLSVPEIIHAVMRSNNDVGARVLEFSEREYMVRGRGYIRSLDDLRDIPVGTDDKGTPILIRDVARVQFGSDMRRGIAELDGRGETVGGIVVMRYGENALEVIDRVKKRIEEIRPSLPKGVEIVPAYDRSSLILAAVRTLREKLIEESLIVSLVCVLFLFHVRSSLVAILVLPIAILLSFIPMGYLKITSNIMSLGGIAIAIGAMIDAAIVMVENAHKRLETAGPAADRLQVILEAAKEVGKPLFFSLLIITVSFLPVLTLEAQEGRLFHPLAYTKSFSMFFAALLSITLAPVLMKYLIRGKIHPEKANPINRFLMSTYEPIIRLALRRKKEFLVGSTLVLPFTLLAYLSLGSEFMPPLNEGSVLYMPTSVPGMSITKAGRILHLTDKVLKSFPEVERVFGKEGKAETSTDPAPMNMVETVVTLKPKDQWRPGMNWDKLLQEMDQALRVPGMPNILWMPIQTRTEMLATGIRSTLGVKVLGPDLDTLEQLGIRIESILKKIRGTSSVYAERAVGGFFVDFEIDRREAARYGLTVGDVQDVLETAIGGENISTTIEGRERYPVNLRYERDYKDDLEKLGRVLVTAPNGAQVPVAQLARVKRVMGPPMIRDENGSLAAFVFAFVSGRDIGGYVREAQKAVRENLTLPPGYRLEWAGQFQYMERAREKLKIVVPMTLFIIFVLLYLNFESVTTTLLVLLTIPFSLVGGILFLALLRYNLSVAVWVGLIALAGVAAEFGIVTILFLDQAYEKRKRAGRMNGLADLYEAVIEGASRRVRPKLMTVSVIMAGLLPIMWSQGTGADVMKRIAAPMIGGMVSATALGLIIIPVIYTILRSREFIHPPGDGSFVERAIHQFPWKERLREKWEKTLNNWNSRYRRIGAYFSNRSAHAGQVWGSRGRDHSGNGGGV